MTDYGRGNVLGVATSLPATSAGVFFLSNNGTHPLIMLGFLIICSISMFVTVSYIFRYLNNKSRK